MTEHDGVRTESATDELRRMLDERGVEWAYSHEWEDKTFWPDANGVNATSTEWGRGLLVHAVLTPEQAIAATLGTGTCHVTDNGPWGYPYVCSACGASFDPDVNNGELNYCPNCGRRCVG